MSSHLSVSYTPTSPAGASAAAAPLGNGAEDAAAAGDNPLGFLAALIDQLLAGGGTPAAAGTTLGANGQPAQDALSAALAALSAGAAAQTQTPQAPPPPAPTSANALLTEITANPKGASLLAHLAKALDAVQKSLDAGESPDADKLKKLADAVDALMALIAPQQALATSPVPTTADTSLDPLAAIGQTTIPPSPTTGTPTPAPVSMEAVPANPGVVALADDLSSFAEKLRATAPGIADKLDALSTQLKTSATDPVVLAKLTSPSDTDGRKLDALIQTLFKDRPATTTTSAPGATPPATVPTAPALAAKDLATPVELIGDNTAKPGSDKPSTDKPAEKSVAAPTTTTTTDAPPASKPTDTASRDGGKSSDTPVQVAAAAAATTSDDTAKRPASDSAVQPIGGPQPPAATSAASAARPLPAAYQAPANPINMGQVAFEMVHQMRKGQSRFTIRLDPPELGRVDVRMHVDHSGAVKAQLTVERTETLDMFQRDKGTLERALAQAGLDSSKTNLEFSLRQNSNPFAGMMGGDRRPGGQVPVRFGTSDDNDQVTAIPAVTLYRGLASAGGVNLFV